MLYTVRGLEDGARGVTIRLRVLRKEDARVVKTRDGEEHRVVDVVVGDGTGITTLVLWDERVDQVSEGDVIDVANGYVNRFKGRLRLNVGKYGELARIEDPKFLKSEQILKMREEGDKRRV